MLLDRLMTLIADRNWIRTVRRLSNRSFDDPTALIVDAYRATEYARRPASRDGEGTCLVVTHLVHAIGTHGVQVAQLLAQNLYAIPNPTKKSSL